MRPYDCLHRLPHHSSVCLSVSAGFGCGCILHHPSAFVLPRSLPPLLRFWRFFVSYSFSSAQPFTHPSFKGTVYIDMTGGGPHSLHYAPIPADTLSLSFLACARLTRLTHCLANVSVPPHSTQTLQSIHFGSDFNHSDFLDGKSARQRRLSPLCSVHSRVCCANASVRVRVVRVSSYA